MPPPRLVKRSSTSSLRSVSVFSGKAGVAGAAGVAVALATGTAEIVGAIDGLTAASGAGVGDNVGAVAGRGGVCLAIHHSHPTKATTESMTTIHAVRSIKCFGWQNHTQRSITG